VRMAQFCAFLPVLPSWRESSPVPRSRLFGSDSLRAWEGVRLSGIPCLQGISREFSSDHCPLGCFRRWQSRRIPQLVAPNSLVSEQGIFMQRAGNVSRWSREILSTSQRNFCPVKGDSAGHEIKRTDLFCQS
jgi:hypothetical protein